MLSYFLRNILLLGTMLMVLSTGESHAHFILSAVNSGFSNDYEAIDTAVEAEIWEDFREYADLECTIPRRLENTSNIAKSLNKNFGLAAISTETVHLCVPQLVVYVDLQPCYGFLFHYTPF